MGTTTLRLFFSAYTEKTTSQLCHSPSQLSKNITNAECEVRIAEVLHSAFIIPSSAFRCGADRDRTDDLLVANQALSQLSYSPKQLAIVNRQFSIGRGC